MSAQQLVIRSADRYPHCTSSDFDIQIPTFSGSGALVFLGASIPNTLYNVTPANNTVTWARGGTPYTATLSPGAYGVTQLIIALDGAMKAADAGTSYQVRYSEVTMKLTISSPMAFSISAGALSGTLWGLIGFKTDRAAGLEHVADHVIRLDFPEHLYVDLGVGIPATMNTMQTRASFIVPMRKISQYMEVYNRGTGWDQLQRFRIHSGLSTLHIRLLRPDGTIADLNGADWTMTLGVVCG